MMLKPSIDKLLDKVPSRYSLVILQAKRAHELAAGAEPTQEFSSVKYTLQALEEIESGNVIIHPNPEAKRKLARLKVIFFSLQKIFLYPKVTFLQNCK